MTGAVLAGAALALPLFPEADDGSLDDEAGQGDWKNLFGIAGKAADHGNGTVQLFAVVTIILLMGAGAASLALMSRDRSVVLAAFACGGLAFISWATLAIAISSAGGGGSIGDLGWTNSVRGLLIPLAAIAVIAAAYRTSETD